MKLDKMRFIEKEGIKYYHAHDVAMAVDYSMTCLINAVDSISKFTGVNIDVLEKYSPDLQSAGAWIVEQYNTYSGEKEK